MNARAGSGGGQRVESVDEVEIDVDVDFGGDEADPFDEAPTSERSRPAQPIPRAEQLRRFALVGMRVAEVAHKLNRATGAILEYAHVLSSAPQSQPASPRAVAAIQRETERCVALSRSVTELATTSSVEPAHVAPEQLLRAAVRLTQQDRERSSRIAFAELKSLPSVFVRRHDVVVALGHVVQNALDATAAEGAVALAAAEATRRGRHGVVLAVTDSGAGIPSADLAHIFEPFFTTRAASGHAGLGLAIARVIVDAEGGQIEIESGAETGTTVRIWLPLPEERPQRPRATSGTRVKRPDR